ncbi:MAG: helix-turn-helix domain-containing protein [Pilosibacter sp.]
MTIEEILAGESKNVEFKVQRPKDSIKYMKTVIAFSNGEGGRIVFGVDDDTREVVGIPKENVFRRLMRLLQQYRSSCEPVVIPDVYLQTIEDKTIIIAEISPGKQRPYYIKSMGIKDGTYIRSGTSRPAGRDLTAEMYYEDEGRSYDKVIRGDLTVTDEEIAELCRQMKEVAIANGKSKTQKEAVKDITKNVLLSWGLLAEAEDGSIHPTNGYVFLLGRMNSCHISNVECSKEKRVLYLWTSVSIAVHYGSRSMIRSSLY